MTGPDGVFEGKYGLWKQMMNGESYDLPLPDRFDGHTFAVQQTMIKSFPTRFNCQVPVFAAQKLRSTINVADIESLRIESIRQAFASWRQGGTEALPHSFAPFSTRLSSARRSQSPPSVTR